MTLYASIVFCQAELYAEEAIEVTLAAVVREAVERMSHLQRKGLLGTQTN